MKNHCLHRVSRRVTVAAILLSAVSAHAAEWTGAGGDTSWANPGNWSPNQVVYADIPAVITTGMVDCDLETSEFFPRNADTFIGGDAVVNAIGKRFQNASAGDANFVIQDQATFKLTGTYFLVAHYRKGSFTQTGGTVDLTLDRGLFLSDQGGAEAKMLISGGTFKAVIVNTGNASSVQVGAGSGNDRFELSGGTYDVSSTVTGRRVYVRRAAEMKFTGGEATFSNFQYFSIGRENGDATAVSKMIVAGGTVLVKSSITQTDAFIVGGGNGQGLLDMSSGSLTINDMPLWIGDGLSGTVSHTGGTLTCSEDFILGKQSTGTAAYTFSGGKLAIAGSTTSGIAAPATFSQSGGEFSTTALSVGGAQAATFSFSGGNSNLGNINLGNGSGPATLNVSGNATVSAGVIRLSQSGDGSALLNLSGGQLTATTVTAGSGTGTSSVNFTGGTLTVSDYSLPTTLASTGTGILAPGGLGSVGSTSISAGYIQAPTATLAIDIAGDSSFDTLVLGADSIINGSIQINLLDGYDPTGKSFNIVTSTGSLTGSPTLTGPAANLFHLSLSNGTLSLIFGQGGPDLVFYPGDTNFDGIVDFDDLTTVLGNYNTTGLVGDDEALYRQGDFDFNGAVDFDDLTALLGNYNTSAPGSLSVGGLSAIPEPSSMALIGFAGLGVLRRRR